MSCGLGHVEYDDNEVGKTIYHIQVTDGNLFHHLENLQEGGEQCIIRKVLVPENNVVISINENHNWIMLKAPPRQE